MMNKFFYGLLAGCLIFACPGRADTTLTLDPTDGAISGAPGTTVGWGFTFTFTNDVNFAVITGSQFCASTSSPLPDICLPLSPDLGSYTDFAGAQFLVAGPSPESPTVMQAFDNTALTGIGSFAIDPSASGTTSGIIVLTYDLFSQNPNDPAFDPNSFAGGNYLTAAASVTAAPVAAVPEPALLPLTGAALLVMVLRRRRGWKGLWG